MKQILFEIRRPYPGAKYVSFKIYNSGTVSLELTDRECGELIKKLQKELKS